MIKYEFLNKDIQILHPTYKSRSGADYFEKLSFKVGYVKPDETEEDAIKRVLAQLLRKDNCIISQELKTLNSDELKNQLRVITHPSPTTYPKFSNEQSFIVYDKYINPKILDIRWDGIEQMWEYRLQNIGHVFDYIREDKFKLTL